MDLKEFYFQNIKESEYHYRFLESVKKVNYTYNIFYGEEETQNYQFEIYDVEEAITKFKELCQPDVDFSGENKCWFYLITYYLHMLGYEIKEFPRILARPPVVIRQIKCCLIPQIKNDFLRYAEALRSELFAAISAHCFM